MSAIPRSSLFGMTGAIIRCCFYTIFTNNRVKFSWIRALVAHRESCWLIFLLRTTVGLTNPANTALCWKAMVTDGTGSADSTIYCVGPTSIGVIPTQVEKSNATLKVSASVLRAHCAHSLNFQARSH